MESKNKQKMYCVVGVAGTGSGSLTFPEDFDFAGVFIDKVKAQKHADGMNVDILEENGVFLEDGESPEDVIAEHDCISYRVMEMPVLG